MRIQHRALAITALVAVLLSMTVLPATGYIEQKQSQVLLSGPNVVKCNKAAKITAKVVSVETGKPIKNQIVRWSLVRSQSSGDGFNATSTITNNKGRASVLLSFGPVAGKRVVQASAFGSSPRITVRCAGGLPRTSTVPPLGFVEPAPAALLPPPVEAVGAGPLPATGLRLERLGIDLPLVEGDGHDVPLGAAAHYPGTAWPGEGSNTYVYAHARDDHFLELWQVRDGDLVEVDMADGTVAPYRVTEVHPMVAWDALEYLAPTDREILTLQTCLTYEQTAPRFVVIAERVDGV
jgi:LPXTG-site transpeptidase (sortase) family protein